MAGLPGSHNVVIALVLAASEAAFIIHMTVELQNIADLHEIAHKAVFVDRGATVGEQEFVHQQDGLLLLAVVLKGDDGLGGVDDFAYGPGDAEHITVRILCIHHLCV